MKPYALKSPRCGRCAEPLPEDTSSYCRICGVPFFRVPPTTDFHLIAEEQYRRALKRQKLYSALFAALLVFVTLAGLVFGNQQMRMQEVAALKPFPKLRFYFYDFPEFATLTRGEKTEATYVAIQAFEDHFNIKIDEYEILHNEVPPQLSFLGTGYFSELSKFHFWDDRVFEKNLGAWIGRDRPTLDIVISNFPIYLGDSKKIESRHLSDEKLISGLGHPSLVVATSYRLLNQIKLKTSQERARHLGEYVIAHELGHGLLGIPDYIVKNEPVYLRGPASVGSAPATLHTGDSNYLSEHCLMHTDAGGGALAWNSIRQRELGHAVECTAYAPVLGANKLRQQAIELAKAGRMREAADAMTLALSQIRSSPEYSKSWVRALWEKELDLMRPGIW
ncbi:MAG TPA: hypothetical protein VM901_10655 [Bdellovibrionota bacterium]|nr:hypothetical protein [Bdellovibrionota bacterium]